MSAPRELGRRGMMRAVPGFALTRWLPALAVLLLAGALGWVVAQRVAERPAVPEATATTLTAGALKLRVGSAWAPAAPEKLPGLSGQAAWAPYAGFSVRVTSTLVARDAALPALAALSRATGGLPQPRTVRVAGLAMREYSSIALGRTRLDLYLLETTGSVLTLACTRSATEPGVGGSCLDAVETLTLAGTQPVTPSRALPLGSAAVAAIHRLNTARTKSRAALAHAKLPRFQAAAAGRLERAHAAAARAIAPLSPVSGAARRLTAELRATAAAYRRLAAAGHAVNRTRWARAKTAVAGAERRLHAALAGV
jgi:hypothetical protein